MPFVILSLNLSCYYVLDKMVSLCLDLIILSWINIWPIIVYIRPHYDWLPTSVVHKLSSYTTWDSLCQHQYYFFFCFQVRHASSVSYVMFCLVRLARFILLHFSLVVLYPTCNIPFYFHDVFHLFKQKSTC